jgi:serine O-acetyltransferase
MYTRFKHYLLFGLFKFLMTAGVDEENSQVLDLICSDVFRYYGKSDYANLKKGLMEHPSLKFLFFFRLASRRPKNMVRKKIHNLAYYFFRRYFFAYGFQIPLATEIGRGFQILHFGNIVFNPSCIIGINCTVAQGVLIGQSNRGVPRIGNQVWIGANAILAGDIVVGNNVLIAPGAYVNISVPDNSLVLGNPCIIYPKTSAIIDGYIVNQIPQNS